MATKKASEQTERVVFVIDAQCFDINCGRITGEPSTVTKLVKFKHRGRSVEVLSLLCHDTLDAAKAAIVSRMKDRIRSVEQLDFDSDNFLVG